MLTPRKCPKRYRDHLRDPDNAIVIERGRFHIVDDRKYRAEVGQGIIRGSAVQEIAVARAAELLADGPFEIYGFDAARIIARQGLVKATDDAFVHALPGSQIHVSRRATFVSDEGAQVHIFGGSASGVVGDGVTVFLYDGADLSKIKVRGAGVSFVDYRADSAARKAA